MDAECRSKLLSRCGNGARSEGDNYAILTDIAGAKTITGIWTSKFPNRKGITGLQMDIKMCGIDKKISGSMVRPGGTAFHP
jgi:polyribonucleotide nucleotidyltransferase